VERPKTNENPLAKSLLLRVNNFLQVHRPEAIVTGSARYSERRKSRRRWDRQPPAAYLNDRAGRQALQEEQPPA